MKIKNVMMFGKKQTGHGFTLFEMLTVLFIFGMVLAAFMGFFKNYESEKRQNITAQNVSDALVAVENYRAVNGRYPIPARLSYDPGNLADNGAEQDLSVLPGVGQCKKDPTDTYVLYCRQQASAGRITDMTNERPTDLAAVPSGDVIIGALPYRALKLAEDKTYDGYGSRLYYAVSKDLTNVTTFFERNGAIKIVDDNNVDMTEPPEAARYIVFSPGKNRVGGWNRNGFIADSCDPDFDVGGVAHGYVGTDYQNCDFLDETVHSEINPVSAATFRIASRRDAGGQNSEDDIVMSDYDLGQSDTGGWRRPVASASADGVSVNPADIIVPFRRVLVGSISDAAAAPFHIKGDGDLRVGSGGRIISSNGFCDKATGVCAKISQLVRECPPGEYMAGFGRRPAGTFQSDLNVVTGLGESSIVLCEPKYIGCLGSEDPPNSGNYKRVFQGIDAAGNPICVNGTGGSGSSSSGSSSSGSSSSGSSSSGSSSSGSSSSGSSSSGSSSSGSSSSGSSSSGSSSSGSSSSGSSSSGSSSSGSSSSGSSSSGSSSSGSSSSGSSSSGSSSSGSSSSGSSSSGSSSSGSSSSGSSSSGSSSSGSSSSGSSSSGSSSSGSSSSGSSSSGSSSSGSSSSGSSSSGSSSSGSSSSGSSSSGSSSSGSSSSGSSSSGSSSSGSSSSGSSSSGSSSSGSSSSGSSSSGSSSSGSSSSGSSSSGSSSSGSSSSGGGASCVTSNAATESAPRSCEYFNDDDRDPEKKRRDLPGGAHRFYKVKMLHPCVNGALQDVEDAYIPDPEYDLTRAPGFGCCNIEDVIAPMRKLSCSALDTSTPTCNNITYPAGAPSATGYSDPFNSLSVSGKRDIVRAKYDVTVTVAANNRILGGCGPAAQAAVLIQVPFIDKANCQVIWKTVKSYGAETSSCTPMASQTCKTNKSRHTAATLSSNVQFLSCQDIEEKNRGAGVTGVGADYNSTTNDLCRIVVGSPDTSNKAVPPDPGGPYQTPSGYSASAGQTGEEFARADPPGNANWTPPSSSLTANDWGSCKPAQFFWVRGPEPTGGPREQQATGPVVGGECYYDDFLRTNGYTRSGGTVTAVPENCLQQEGGEYVWYKDCRCNKSLNVNCASYANASCFWPTSPTP